MAQPARTPANQPKKVEEVAAEEPTSRLRWLLGWVVTPLLFFGAIFVGGVYVGANHPDVWISSLVRWLTGLF